MLEKYDIELSLSNFPTLYYLMTLYPLFRVVSFKEDVLKIMPSSLERSFIICKRRKRRKVMVFKLNLEKGSDKVD